MSLLTLANIETYYGPIMAIHGVSLTVEEGQIAILLGANGAGKTTVLKTISGAMDPQKGKVLFDDQEIQGKDPDEVARMGVAHVPEGREVFPFLTVKENLLMGAYSRSDGEIADDIDMVLEYFPVLKEKAAQQSAFLSGGQQQMLAIGRALMAEPSLLLIDELSLGLMPKIIDQCYEVIQELKKQGMTLLIVEQNTKKALEVSEQVLILESGRKVWEGKAEDAKNNPEIFEAYLGLSS